jgi:hypothetical protein
MVETPLSFTAVWTKRLTALLLFGATVLCWASISVAQGGSPLTIRVEAKEVVVPVVVVDKSDVREMNLPGIEAEEFDKEITGLTLKDFRVFEDGKEQKVQNLDIEPWAVQAQDEFSPRGIWWHPITSSQGQTTLSFPLHIYRLSYIPPPALEGSCHRIKISINHHHATVSAPTE